MKLLVFLAAWRRPEITEICFMGIRRLKEASDFQIDTMCVISEESMIPLCEEYDIDYCFYKNKPLGEKKNFGLNQAMLKSWDYMMEIGSDDVLKNEILDAYKPYFEKGERFFGIKDFLYINSEDGNCRRLKSDTTYGAARCVSRKVLESVAYGVDVVAKEDMIVHGVGALPRGKKGFLKISIAKEMEALGRVEIVGQPRYRLWRDDLNQSLDNNSTMFLMKNVVGHITVPTENALGIDIKSRENIWAFNPTLGEPYELSEALIGLSSDEKIAILSLIKKRNQCAVEVR